MFPPIPPRARFTDFLDQAICSKIKEAVERPPSIEKKEIVHSFFDRFLGKTFFLKRAVSEPLQHRIVEKILELSDFKEKIALINVILKEVLTKANLENLFFTVKDFLVAFSSIEPEADQKKYTKDLLEKLGIHGSFADFKKMTEKQIKKKFPEIIKQGYLLTKGVDPSFVHKLFAAILAFLSKFYSIEAIEAMAETGKKNFHKLDFSLEVPGMKESSQAASEIFIYFFLQRMTA